VEIETPRLLLRQFKKTDWKEVHEYAADPEVARYMEWGPNTVDDTVAFVEMTLHHQKEKPRRFFDFAVTLKDSGKLIGACGFRLHPALEEQADVGYVFNKKYWRQGYGAEACGAVLDLGFSKFNLHRMFATCDGNNVGSAGVMRKCGMRQEGHFVQDKKIKGIWRDTLLFAILRNEWEQRR
jgi:RimJ/RimL family protein N-acetyltransferase